MTKPIHLLEVEVGLANGETVSTFTAYEDRQEAERDGEAALEATGVLSATVKEIPFHKVGDE